MKERCEEEEREAGGRDCWWMPMQSNGEHNSEENR